MELESKEIKLLQGIDTVIIRVSNIETSKNWYTNKLGLSALWEDANMKLVVLDTGGPTSLTLWQTGQTLRPPKEAASFPIFKTPDAGALRQELGSKGMEVGEVVQDDFVRYFVFFDPDGNILEACQVHG
jgi:catechol 2,3-dioxygenase-like lactoylglutathione lyase family enzyme